MIRLTAAAFAMLVTGVQDSATPSDPPPIPVTLEPIATQITVFQRIIIRIPRGEPRVPASTNVRRWREAGSMRCIPARQIVGALPAANTVDFVMRDNRRFRARFASRCGGLDYYRGLYLDSVPDGMICANRDVIRSRMGGECAISEFRQLQLDRP